MQRRTFGVLLGPCLIAGMLVAVAPQAQAQRPFGVQQLMPNDTPQLTTCSASAPTPGHPGCAPNALTDKFDGVDSLAHLTAVATPETTQVTWYACPAPTTLNPSNAEIAACNITIGTDSAGVVPPIGPGAGSPADEAYDITWDIPGSVDNQRRDIVALACIGTAQNLDGGSANCRASVEENIFLEDAQTGAAQNQTTSGELGAYRTMQACFDIASGDAACDAARKAFPHGSPVPNDGFDFQAFTSDDVGQLEALVHSPVDAQAAPNNGNFTGANQFCVLEQTFTNFKRWRCALNDGQVPNDAEVAVSLADNSLGKLGGSGGYCNAANNEIDADRNPGNGNQPAPAQNQVPGAHDHCILDVHYVVSSARQPARVLQSFGANAPSPSAGAGCTPGTTSDTDETSQLGTQEDIIICMQDQFTDPFSGQWTEETSGAGRIEDCGPYTPHDHDGDGRIDDCHGSTGGPDGASANLTVSNPSGPPGDQVLTSCFDPQNQATNPPPANHGCADAPAALKATLTVHWGTTATEVFLAFNNPPPTNAADPCRTGVTFKANNVGDHDEITVCTFDSSGNPVPTDTSAQRLIWTITGAQGEEPTAIRFNPAPPPSETTGSGASATAGIDAVQEGDNFVNVFLLDSNGDPIDAFSLEKQVHQINGHGRDVATNLTAKKSPRFIRGKAVTEDECRPGRQVTLFRRRRGADGIVGVDTTNSLGRWSVKTGKRRGTYYARVTSAAATDAQTGGQLLCLQDQSKDVRRR